MPLTRVGEEPLGWAVDSHSAAADTDASDQSTSPAKLNSWRIFQYYFVSVLYTSAVIDSLSLLSDD